MLVLGALLAGACGGLIAGPSEQERCIASGGEWSGGDCGGAQDHCGLVACENAMGEGCVCPGTACWDGDACVDGSEDLDAVGEGSGGA